MQDVDLIEKLTGFVRSLYERIRDWGFRHPWVVRPFWYFVLLMVVLVVCRGTFNYFEIYHTDADSARYMLSAMVQAQAAIIAIVITLTLIAVQLTASAYSPRVIRVFRNDPDMWLLLSFYGVSMLYGLVVLKMVEGEAGDAVSQGVFGVLGYVPMSFEYCVSVAYWLEAFTLVALFQYMLNIIDLLKPENIIDRLAIEITKDNILNLEEDPIQPIVDVIHGSVMKYDIATTRYGLKAITEKAIEVIHSDCEKETSEHFCVHLERIGKLTVSREDGESVIKVLESLESFGKVAAEKGLENVAKSLGVVGRVAAEKGLEDAAKHAAKSLGLVGRVAVEKKLEKAVTQTVESLGSVGRVAMVNELEDAAWQATSRLGLVGEDATKQGFDDAAERAASHLGRVGGVAAANRFGRVAKEAAKCLGSIGKVAVEEKLVKRSIVMRAIESLGLVGEIAAEEELKDATLEATTHLGLVGKVAVEKGLEFKSAVERVIESLRFVGEIAVGSDRLKNTIFQVAFRFVSIGIVATEKKGLDVVARQAADCLAELAISSKEIVENAIEFNGFKFEERNQKFLNLYEQQLEKLLVEKSE